MSTDFRSLTPIRMADLFDGRLENGGVHEHHSKDATADRKCLTDGRNFLWVCADEEGLVSIFSRYGMNAPQRILHAIADEFQVNIVSEYEPEFWGYKTEEEWESACVAIAQEQDQKFYNEAVKFIRGEVHNIPPRTNWMTMAEIAKRLVAESPDLLTGDRRPDLIKAVKQVYDRDHAVIVTLSDEEEAFARMAAAHEDDLPQA